MAGCTLLMVSVCPAEDRAPQARSLYQQESYEEVIDLLGKSDAEGTLTAQEAYYLGLSQKQAGQPDAAIANLKKALNPPNPAKEAIFHLGFLLISKDLDAEVATLIERAEKENVRPGEIAYLKGVLLAKQGQTSAAIRAFTVSKNADPAYTQRADMQIAMLQIKQMDLSAAKASLEAVITSDPSSELAGFARDYSSKIESSLLGPKKWSILAGISYQWDDNAVAKPGRTVPGVTFPKKSDGGVNENIQVTYNTRTPGPWQMSAQYSLYNNNYNNLREYSQMSNTLALIPSYMMEKPSVAPEMPVVFSLPVTFNYTHLNYKGYSDQISIKPTATVIFTPTQLGQISGGYARRDILGTPVYPAQNRDAHILNALLGYYYLFADNRGMANLRYEFIFEGADGNDWRNNGNKIAADLLIPVTKTTGLILSGDATFKYYLASPITPKTNRKDNVYTAAVTVKQQLMKGFFLNIQYSNYTTDSNVALYDYTRNVYSAGLEVHL